MCNVEIMNNDHTQVLKLEQNRPAEAGSEEQKHANDRMQREIADMYNTDGLLDLSYGEEDNDEMVHDMPTMVQDTHAMVHEPPFQQKPAITPIADMTVLAPPPERYPLRSPHTQQLTHPAAAPTRQSTPPRPPPHITEPPAPPPPNPSTSTSQTTPPRLLRGTRSAGAPPPHQP